MNVVMFTLENIFTTRLSKRYIHCLVSTACAIETLLVCQPSLAEVLQSGNAASWQGKFNLNVIESYSDNIYLASKGKEQGDWVTQISPGLTLTNLNPELKVNAQYQLQRILYADNSNKDSTFSKMNAVVNSEPVKNKFFVDGIASSTQQNYSSYMTQASDNTNITGNRINVSTLSISPYLRHQFYDLVTSEVHYTHSNVNSSVAGLSNTDTNLLAFKLYNPVTLRRLGWGITYNKQQTRYSGNLQTINNSTLSGNLSFKLFEHLALNVQGGHEVSDYSSTGAAPGGNFYSGGFTWMPGTRTTISASTGHRYFGNNNKLDAKFRTPLTSWYLTYSEGITTTQGQFLADANATAMQQSTGPLNLLTNQIFLQKDLLASVTLTGQRNTLTLNLFDRQRSAQTSQTVNSSLFTANSLLLDNQSTQLGGGAVWNRKLSPRTTGNLLINYSSNRQSGSVIPSSNSSMQLSVTTKLPKKSNSVTFALRHNQTSAGTTGVNTVENVLSAALTMQF